ncbi:MAG: hypothetical protein ACK5F7_20220, partial [Planctomycetaceae bacterium]
MGRAAEFWAIVRSWTTARRPAGGTTELAAGGTPWRTTRGTIEGTGATKSLAGAAAEHHPGEIGSQFVVRLFAVAVL